MAHPATATDEEPLPPPIIYDFAPIARELLGCPSRQAILAGPKGATIRKAIEDEIAARDVSIISFDVFDTFLLRNNKPETARYHELSIGISNRLADHVSKPPGDIDLLIARLRGMDFSYRTRKAVEGCREGHIEQVISFARTALNLPRDTEAVFLESELDYEAANLSVNPVLADIAAAFRSRGGKVILVSDMYLGKSQIAAILNRLSNGANGWYDKIYSSADHILSKRAGKIFGFIERDLGIGSKEFLHLGDAFEGDVIRCRDAGWNAVHFPISLAEIAERERTLRAFVADMKCRGHDLSPWARL